MGAVACTVDFYLDSGVSEFLVKRSVIWDHPLPHLPSPLDPPPSSQLPMRLHGSCMVHLACFQVVADFVAARLRTRYERMAARPWNIGDRIRSFYMSIDDLVIPRCSSRLQPSRFPERMDRPTRPAVSRRLLLWPHPRHETEGCKGPHAVLPLGWYTGARHTPLCPLRPTSTALPITLRVSLPSEIAQHLLPLFLFTCTPATVQQGV